ncbi:MAG: hypothetical protein HRU24_16040 [Gammaproteobacteria bacterium]|nr:hypothetical protein [Gammaproteobacteria bacterium]
MSERTESNKKLELKMGLFLIMTVVMLAVPFTLAVFRSETLVALFSQSAPFVLITIAVSCILWAKKSDS